MSYTYNPFNPGNRNEDFSVLVIFAITVVVNDGENYDESLI